MGVKFMQSLASCSCWQLPRVKEGSQSVELGPDCIVKEVKLKIASRKN